MTAPFSRNTLRQAILADLQDASRAAAAHPAPPYTKRVYSLRERAIDAGATVGQVTLAINAGWREGLPR